MSITLEEIKLNFIEHLYLLVKYCARYLNAQSRFVHRAIIPITPVQETNKIVMPTQLHSQIRHSVLHQLPVHCSKHVLMTVCVNQMLVFVSRIPVVLNRSACPLA